MSWWYIEYNEGQGLGGLEVTTSGRKWQTVRSEAATPAELRMRLDPEGTKLHRVQQIEHRAMGASLALQLELPV